MNRIIDDKILIDIADAIREKNGSTIQYEDSEMPQAIKDIESGGGVDYMPYAGSVKFSSAISEITDDIYLDFPNASSLMSLFHGVNINCNKITLKISNKLISLASAFRASGAVLKEVEIIGDTSKITDISRAFYDCMALEIVRGELDLSSCEIANNLINIFANCYNLKTFTPKANTIKASIIFGSSAYLTDETIQSIIDGLADMTGTDTSPVLTFHATVKSKLTPEQIATITNKNWTLA